MEQEHSEKEQAPPRFYEKNWSKVAALTLLFIVIFFSVGFIGLEGTSSSKFCASCHEMKPEYYTWKASSHSEVDCVSCHVDPGLENLAKAKANGAKQAFKSVTKTYTAPIQMPKNIPDSACETCHNMNKREATPTGDLIIPHTKHKEQNITCTECHSGVAHGKIAERKVTFQSDYSKWDEDLGQSMMKDPTFIRPKMETCMDCHAARNVSTACETCHTTKMYPDSHKKPGFKDSTHGTQAAKNMKECNDCHKYMSKDEITLFNDRPAHSKYIQGEKVAGKKVDVKDYAKENTFCEACHMQRPPSHDKQFIATHGATAKKSSESCLACHDYQKTGINKTNNVTCSSCHPSSHNGKQWRLTHPIRVNEGAKLTQTCYSCHFKPKCSSCHKETID
ncbi:NapC/NirT family cytochrome c [Bacillus sp. REN3]|uniref:NapC/NirT family cytochrome c n=1 Tax=Bacillus sp. REN3 TaxID=2802440 RepID=UPI001FEDBE76|nr:NapC/NirT family cytochrome c [Bacillus sp. REN3]